MRLNIDTPQIQGNELPPELNKWFANIVDQINYMFGNIIATTVDVGNQGAGPISVIVPGMSASSLLIEPWYRSSTILVTILSATQTATGFDILFSGDPGLHAYVDYVAFLLPWEAQGA